MRASAAAKSTSSSTSSILAMATPQFAPPLMEREVYRHLQHHRNGLLIQEGGLVDPLRHRIQSGLGQQGVTGENLHLHHAPADIDDGIDANFSLNPRLLGNGGIEGLDAPNQLRRLDVAADPNGLRRRRRRGVQGGGGSPKGPPPARRPSFRRARRRARHRPRRRNLPFLQGHPRSWPPPWEWPWGPPACPAASGRRGDA